MVAVLLGVPGVQVIRPWLRADQPASVATHDAEASPELLAVIRCLKERRGAHRPADIAYKALARERVVGVHFA